MLNPFLGKMVSFYKSDTAPGILLISAAVLAIVFANSELASFYQAFISTPISIGIGSFEIAKPSLLWINDGLMAVFFFLIGLELKRELIEGELSQRSNIVLPSVGALGGMITPALIYAYFNYDNPETLRGWAIPAATDIAFTLGILSLLGSRVPISIKIFLVSLATFDDVGAIIIIAIFYTEQLSISALLAMIPCIFGLLLLNRLNIPSKLPYFVLGILLWVATLKSGVHATISGILLALFIPLYSDSSLASSPLKSLERDLSGWVNFAILPIFAFANAGLQLSSLSLNGLSHSVPLGIALGLFFGKQFGVFAFCWISIKLKLTELPSGFNTISLYGCSLLCGIGFTMSLFIGSLAFNDSAALGFDERSGIIAGSMLSGILGYLVLHFGLPRHSYDKS